MEVPEEGASLEYEREGLRRDWKRRSKGRKDGDCLWRDGERRLSGEPLAKELREPCNLSVLLFKRKDNQPV